MYRMNWLVIHFWNQSSYGAQEAMSDEERKLEEELQDEEDEEDDEEDETTSSLRNSMEKFQQAHGLAFLRHALTPSKNAEDQQGMGETPLVKLVDCFKRGDKGQLPAAAAGYWQWVAMDRKRLAVAAPVLALAVCIMVRPLQGACT